eukprot:gene6229-biopygen4094
MFGRVACGDPRITGRRDSGKGNVRHSSMQDGWDCVSQASWTMACLALWLAGVLERISVGIWECNRSGITIVRDVGDPASWDLGVQKQQARNCEVIHLVFLTEPFKTADPLGDSVGVAGGCPLVSQDAAQQASHEATQWAAQ